MCLRPATTPTPSQQWPSPIRTRSSFLQDDPAQPARQPGWPGGPALPPSFEGGDQRCFRHMFVCNNGVRGSGLPVYSYGQHLVEYYKPLLAPPVLAAAAAGSAGGSKPTSVPDAGAGAAASGKARVLRIVFQKRGEGHPGRAILNIRELLQRCNEWQYEAPSGRVVRAACLEVRSPGQRCRQLCITSTTGIPTAGPHSSCAPPADLPACPALPCPALPCPAG